MRMASTLPVVSAVLISGALTANTQSGTMAMQGQQPKPGSSGAYTLHVDAEEVVLNCTVLDNKGELVNDLTRSNFKVFDDNAVQTVLSLQHQDTLFPSVCSSMTRVR
jgi:Ca-activated chloride channel homolog